jgi:hypothetical protein
VSPDSTIALSLIAHTNAGKTTLARTLLGRDVGSVRDEQHVTQEAASYPLIATAEGDTLVLWDTPGFGDSARLARRLGQQGNPVGWFLSQVWDRFRDRAFFLSQQLVRNVRDQADVVLYLVNASESPEDAGYLAPELAVLEWVGKPVVVLINQTGRPRPHAEEQAEEAIWRNALGPHPIIRAVTTFDAFARCWVQELLLFELVGSTLPEARRATWRRLADAWQARRLAQFDRAMSALAAPIAAASCDRATLHDAGTADALRGIGSSLGLGTDPAEGARVRASQAMATRLDEALRQSTDRLIELYGLEGRAKREVLERLAGALALDAPMSEGKAAVMGGVVSGALSGLAADLAAGGLTFGAGMLTGALLGALGGAGIARGLNLARGKSGATLRWDNAFLSSLVGSAVLRYLAVAHYGRGRGNWAETEYPPFWKPLVAEIVERQADRLGKLWAKREPVCDVEIIASDLCEILAGATMDALNRLYPGVLAGRTAASNGRDAAIAR